MDGQEICGVAVNHGRIAPVLDAGYSSRRRRKGEPRKIGSQSRSECYNAAGTPVQIVAGDPWCSGRGVYTHPGSGFTPGTIVKITVTQVGNSNEREVAYVRLP